MLAHSLERVPIDWIARNFKVRGKLRNDVESSLAEDHLLFQFKTVERDSILHGGPWVVAGQLLAIEPWVPDFVPSFNIVKRTMAWLCKENNGMALSPQPAY